MTRLMPGQFRLIKVNGIPVGKSAYYLCFIKNMKMPGKQKRLSVLMALSLMMLTAFVGYWLRSQYHSAREGLEKELTVFYIDTQDELIDTLLFKSYVHPVLASGNGIITVNIRSNPDSLRWKADTMIKGEKTEEMILRSVKMIVGHVSDSSGTDTSEFTTVIRAIDPAQFRIHFISKMKEADMPFLFDWAQDTDSTLPGREKRLILINPLPGSKLPEARVAGFRGYLFMQILPQVIFGVILVMLTAMAFWLSYRNLRSHTLLNNLRDEFVSNITHELKTPVATVRVALESVGKYNLRNDPGKLDEYMYLALRETDRLEKLINRILDHSALEEVSQIIDVTKTDLTGLLREVTGTYAANTSGAVIELETEEDDIRVSCDPLLMKSVITNLIDNSIKYSGDKPIVKITSRIERDSAIIEVSDNGPGIPEEYRSKIFEKFFRLPTANVHNVKGYGLGLSFARLVTELHGGTISVTGNEHGSTFTIKLPYR